MGRGQRQQDEIAAAPRGRVVSSRDDERAEVVSVTVWVKRSLADPTRVSVEATASAYDADLCNDYDIPEAGGRELDAEPFTLGLLREMLDEELAEALADELRVPYRSRSGIAP